MRPWSFPVVVWLLSLQRQTAAAPRWGNFITRRPLSHHSPPIHGQRDDFYLRTIASLTRQELISPQLRLPHHRIASHDLDPTYHHITR